MFIYDIVLAISIFCTFLFILFNEEYYDLSRSGKAKKILVLHPILYVLVLAAVSYIATKRVSYSPFNNIVIFMSVISFSFSQLIMLFDIDKRHETTIKLYVNIIVIVGSMILSWAMTFYLYYSLVTRFAIK